MFYLVLPFPPLLFDDVKGGEAASRTIYDICMFPFQWCVVCLHVDVALHIGMHGCLSSSTSDVCPCNLLKILMNIEISEIPTLIFFRVVCLALWLHREILLLD